MAAAPNRQAALTTKEGSMNGVVPGTTPFDLIKKHAVLRHTEAADKRERKTQFLLCFFIMYNVFERFYRDPFTTATGRVVLHNTTPLIPV